MAERNDPPALRWLIGVELTNYRKASGVSQAAAAKAIGLSPGMIGHYEVGKYFPAPEQVARLLEVYGAPRHDIDRLSALAGRSDQGSWLARWNDVIPDWLRTYVGLEGLASHVVTYTPLVLPALVQTREYAAGVTSPSARVRPDQQERMVALRMERQQRLFAEDLPLQLTAMIEESILDRPIGGDNAREVMAEQLSHLNNLARRDNVEILVLPTAVGRHDGLEGRFTVLHFLNAEGGKQAQSIGYVEIPDDSVYVQDQHQVEKYTMSAQLLRSVALSQAQSVKAIKARLAALG
ncbi:helix-turn-helix domain-containing protein [Kibdelosporangium phytohabitans]|uniref:XRE family transcriptional regulator n=1 Tax=Kibdelosporangium phytohabitans TaxID=860235 RepID=A0A0N7F3Q5_9PSEU|nr:helix-turn-helix transcriptional regulator [Kibdelosporangium phytohabitans]ALG09287.1 XRE family transcriptional regulator [Kibdelosporangium phytohabitans]MBE1469461.1 transcriptional regulator with XRE-family HTH domain [Kibdelosporangium phytohabitans]